MIKKLMNLFRIPYDNCGTYSGAHHIGTHGMNYEGKMVEDVCHECEEKIWKSIL